MVELHKDWVNRLQGVRSRLIHERNAVGASGYTIASDGDGFRVTFSFALSPLVVTRLRFLESLRDEEGRVNLVAGTEQVGLRALDAATAVMSALLADFGGRLVAGSRSEEAHEP